MANESPGHRLDPNAPQEKKVLHIIERYVREAQKAAEAEIKKHPLEYVAAIVISAATATAAEHFGLNHALAGLAGIAGAAAATGSAIAMRRYFRNQKEGLDLPLLTRKERAFLRKLILGAAHILGELGRKFDKPALGMLAAALIFVVKLALPMNETNPLPPHWQGTEWVTPTPAAPVPPAKFANLHWTVAYNPPVYSAPVKTIVTVQGLYPWPVNDNA